MAKEKYADGLVLALVGWVRNTEKKDQYQVRMSGAWLSIQRYLVNYKEGVVGDPSA
jgi:hypothetical protein